MQNHFTILSINPIQDGHFWGCSQIEGGGGGKGPPPPPKNLSHISYNDETWNSYNLPKEDPKKYVNHVIHPLSSAESAFFHRKSANIAISRNTDID